MTQKTKEIDGIEKQYRDHPYPEPIKNIKNEIIKGYTQISDYNLIWSKLFPEREYKDNLNVLIAGCGTNQAVYHAIKFPNSRHYAIDVSETTVDYVKSMISKYKINNLEVEKKEILDLKIKNEFDYVVSTGVIHHTENPQENLNKLVCATKNDGALFIMVYAIYLRYGIYLLQDVFRYLKIQPTEKGISLLKNLLRLLPKDHYALNYIRANEKNLATRDLEYDASFVDTFLNPRDVAFDIQTLKNFIKESGSYFQCWYDNANFYMDLIDFTKEKALNSTYESLDPWEKADFNQKFNPSAGIFTFILRKKKEFEHLWFNINGIKKDTYASKFLFKTKEPLDIKKNKGGFIKHGQTERKLNAEEMLIWNNLNDNVDNILNKVNQNLEEMSYNKITLKELKIILHNFWKQGYINFSFV